MFHFPSRCLFFCFFFFFQAEDGIRDGHVTGVQTCALPISAVNVADISTIDSFCLRFLKKYYYAIDLDPNFRVLADESERNVLREDVWQEVRESFYQAYEDLNLKSSLDRSEERRVGKEWSWWW